MAALGKQPWVGSNAPMDRVIVLPSRSMTTTFLAKKTSVNSQKERNDDTQYKINTEHTQANAKSGKPKHALFMNLK